jgi:cell wall-associated NlpC family hydrolase
MSCRASLLEALFFCMFVGMRGDSRFSVLSFLLSTLAVFYAIGCSSSSPRFRSSDSSTSAIIQEDDVFRFASKIKEEEMSEDDKKVNLDNVKRRILSRTKSSTRYKNETPEGLNRDRFLLNVVSYLGVPYDFGGSSKQGIDCSALTSKVYSTSANLSLPRSTKNQYRVGSAVSKGNLQFGDLVFFNTIGHGPSHVGIYVEDDLFVHASVSYGVTFSSLESSYYKKRFIGARRVVN